MPYKDYERQKEYQRLYTSQRRADYLSDKCCAVCSSTTQLEVDHINPDTKVSHRIWSWAKDRRDAELTKCQVLCHVCHKEKTKEYMKSRRQHGRTLYAHGCRCEVCYEAQKKHNAQRNASKA